MAVDPDVLTITDALEARLGALEAAPLDCCVDGDNYPLTVPGVNEAMQDQAALGGGAVHVPNVNIPLTHTVVIPNRVWLHGEGVATEGRYTFRGAGVDLDHGVTNEHHDGTQHFVGIRDLSIAGQKGDTQIDHLIYLKGVYVGSEVANVHVRDGSGNGVTIDGGGHPKPGTQWTKNPADPVVRVGPLLMEHIWSISNEGDGFLFTGSVNIQGRNLTSENPGPGSACFNMTANMAVQATASMGSVFEGLHMEGNDPTIEGLVIDGQGALLVQGVHWGGSQVRAVVTLKNEVGVSAYPNASPVFSCAGVQLQQVSTGVDRLLIDDQINDVQIVSNHRHSYMPFEDA